MDLEEKQISENTLYRGKVITVQLCGVELPNGHESVREVVRHSGGAAVLLVSGGKILMERQFRFPYNKVIWEIPAGKLNKGENPEHAARRELEEETGFRAEKLARLVEVYPSP
ncbi:MAG: NUDIX domain-containing protein, partial [Oscillospiraceae bacterium]